MSYAFRFVEDPVAVEELLRVRYKVFVEEWGWLEPNNTKIDRDEWEDHSLHIGAYNEYGQAVGTLRTVRDSPIGFPGERVHDFGGIVNRDEALEASRLAVLNGERGHGSSVLIGLGRGVYQAGQIFKKDYWIAVMDAQVVRVLKMLGFKFEYEADTTVFYIGSDCKALVCSMEETRRVMYSPDLEARATKAIIEEFHPSKISASTLAP